MLDRSIAPPIKDAIEFKLELPPYAKHRLSNGVEVYAIDLGTEEALMVSWIFDAGNWWEDDKYGIAVAANMLLKNGTGSHNAFALNEHFEYYGSWLSRSSQHETADITLHCLSKHVGELLPVVAEIISDSRFPEEELEIYKKNSQQRLQVSLKKSDFVAGREIEAYLYGKKHPYGRYSSAEEFQALDTDTIRKFYDKHYRQGACRIIVAGKLPPDLISQLDKYFGKLPLHVPAPLDPSTFPALSPATQKKYEIANDTNGVQGSIRIAREFPNRHHPDFQKVQMLNNVFGGFFGSRLMANIREDKGYTYGIYSYLLNNRQASGWMITTEAGKDVCRATIEEVYKEMELLKEELVDEEELQVARNFTIGTILGDLDGAFQVAARWKNIILNGMDANYFYEGVRIVKSITPEELQELAKKYLNPEDFYELVVV